MFRRWWQRFTKRVILENCPALFHSNSNGWRVFFELWLAWSMHVGFMNCKMKGLGNSDFLERALAMLAFVLTLTTVRLPPYLQAGSSLVPITDCLVLIEDNCSCSELQLWRCGLPPLRQLYVGLGFILLVMPITLFGSPNKVCGTLVYRPEFRVLICREVVSGERRGNLCLFL